MFDIFYGIINNTNAVEGRLTKQMEEYSLFYNKMIHKMALMLKEDKQQPEYLETYRLMSETMNRYERIQSGMRPDKNSLKYIRKMAIDKFNLMLAGEEKYSPRNRYSINSIVIDGFGGRTGHCMIGDFGMKIAWVDSQIEIEFGNRKPTDRKPSKAIISKGLIGSMPDKWGIMLYCRGDTKYKRRENRP